jgi:phage-related protein
MALVPVPRVTQTSVVRVIEGGVEPGPPDPAPEPHWDWCPAPGMSRSWTHKVEIAAYGDGYKHRATRGLNPFESQWQCVFPFKTMAELSAMGSFLANHGVTGFYFSAPDSGGWIFVTCDNMSWTVSERRRDSEDYIGTLQASFDQAHNPQPISPPL